MDFRIIWALILTILPISELRGGLPLAIIYATDHNIPIIFIFSLVILLNILVIFFVFYFLDNIHHIFLNFKFYKKFFEFYVKKFQRKIDKFEKRYSVLGFLALTLFVAVPLPVTGAWSGCLVSWMLDLDRKKSILAISLGVIIAGIIILFGTIGLINLFF
ncbi:MAG: COG2426 family protein [Candidatus Thorarchaeota archaeon]